MISTQNCHYIVNTDVNLISLWFSVQLLQLVKSRSKEQRLGILFEGQNRKDYTFNSMQVCVDEGKVEKWRGVKGRKKREGREKGGRAREKARGEGKGRGGGGKGERRLRKLGSVRVYAIYLSRCLSTVLSDSLGSTSVRWCSWSGTG